MSTSDYPAASLDRPRLPRLRADLRGRAIPADVWLVIALVAIATAIRLLTIDNQSFWMDEALTAYETHLPFGAMLNTVAHVETTPPLYFVLIWVWAKVFGSGEIALRSISTIAGIALVPIAYLSAKELVSRWAGVIAAAFVAVNPFLIWYSQEARAYMLLAVLTGAGFLWFVRCRREPTTRNLAWWAACSSLAVMTHFFAGFAVAPQALWLLWLYRRRAVIAAVGVVAAVQVAMAPFALIDTSHGTGWIAAVPKVDRIGTAALEWGISLLYRRATISEGLIGGAALLVVVGLLLGLGGDHRTRQGAKVAAVVAGCVALLPLALAFAGQDYFLSRNLIPAFVPLAVLVAAACVAPRARLLGGALAVALLTMFSLAAAQVQTHPYLQRPNWRDVARVLGHAPVSRAILASGGTTADPLKIYLPSVNWVQPHGKRILIREVDVVGATKRAALVPSRTSGPGGVAVPERSVQIASSLPRKFAPPGARLLSRIHVDNWVVARFALAHPARLSINQLTAIAHKFFRHTPAALLVFMQRPIR